jgi:hypothetical protein
MAGFWDRQSSSIGARISDNLRRISNLGMKYDDLVIKQSRAIGPTEAEAGGDLSSRDIAYAMAMADINQKKYLAIFDQQYRPRRDYLRQFALNSEIDFMVTTVADETIVFDEKNFFAYPSISDMDVKDEIKEEIDRQYKRIYTRFGFNDNLRVWQCFRQFLIDGILAFEIVFDEKGKNVIGLKELDGAFLRQDVRNENGVLKKVWYSYPDDPKLARMLYDTQVIYISYASGNLISRISYVENMVRSFNLLRTIENSQAMWLLMNATWRMKMIVPIGSKSPQKARESLGELMSLYKEDITLDPNSGELQIHGSPSSQYYKNYVFPSKNGENVDISPMPGEGPDMQNGNLTNYWQNKLKEDSKIPFARFDKALNGGQLAGTAATGVDREEIRFGKFCNRLRSAFQEILIKPLWIQMCIQRKDLENDELFKASLGLSFTKDNIFEEMRSNEILDKRIDIVTKMQSVLDREGKPFFDTAWLVERYLKFDKQTMQANEDAKKKAAEEEPGEAADGNAPSPGESESTIELPSTSRDNEEVPPGGQEGGPVMPEENLPGPEDVPENPAGPEV